MKKIIIADTILAVLDRAGSLFERGGIALHAAATTEEVLFLHREIRADLIIMDAAQPGMGGMALAGMIRRDDALKAVSIIMAWDGDRESLPAPSQTGANALIAKPVDSVELLQKVSDLLVVSQRKNMRVLLRVAVSGSPESPIFAQSENVSISGMLLETSHPFAPGDRMTCAFLIGHSDIRTAAEVVRIVPTPSGRYQCGVRFLNLDTKSMIVIEQFVRTRIRTAGA